MNDEADEGVNLVTLPGSKAEAYLKKGSKTCVDLVKDLPFGIDGVYVRENMIHCLCCVWGDHN